MTTPMPWQKDPRRDAQERDRGALFFLIASLLSVSFHLSLGWYLYDIHFGHFDPEELNEPRELYHLVRTDRDLIVDDSAGNGPGALTDSRKPGETPSPKKLHEDSRRILDASGGPLPQATSLTDSAAMGRVEPHREVRASPGAPDAGSVTPRPKVNLPDSVTNNLVPGANVDVAFVDQPKSGPRGAGHDSAARTAKDLLSGSKLGGAGKGAGTGNGDGSGSNPGVSSGPGGAGIGGGGGSGGGTGFSDRRPGPLDLGHNQPVLVPIKNVPAPPLKIGDDTENLDDDFDYAVVRYDDPNPAAGSAGGYARIDITPKPTLRRLRTMPKDVIFLIDTSGSITQEWVDKTAAGVKEALNTLNTDDRFNIVYFNNKPAFFSQESISPVTEKTIARAADFLDLARCGGTTDINRALSRLLVRDLAVQRVYDLVIFTDGQPTVGVKDTRELINLITHDNDLVASIYCVGIGPAVNHELLEFLAYRNHGFCVYPSSIKNTPYAIVDMFSQLRYPIMKEIKLSAAGLEGNSVFPRDVPNLHQSQTITLFGRYSQAAPFTLRLAGHNGQKRLDFTFTRDLAQAPPGDARIARDWAFWRLHDLYNQILSVGETPQIKAEMDAIKKQYGLKTLY